MSFNTKLQNVPSTENVLHSNMLMPCFRIQSLVFKFVFAVCIVVSLGHQYAARRNRNDVFCINRYVRCCGLHTDISGHHIVYIREKIVFCAGKPHFYVRARCTGTLTIHWIIK